MCALLHYFYPWFLTKNTKKRRNALIIKIPLRFRQLTESFLKVNLRFCKILRIKHFGWTTHEQQCNVIRVVACLLVSCHFERLQRDWCVSKCLNLERCPYRLPNIDSFYFMDHPAYYFQIKATNIVIETQKRN